MSTFNFEKHMHSPIVPLTLSFMRRMIHLLSGTTIPGLPPLSRQVIIDRVPPLILGFIVAFSPRFAPTTLSPSDPALAPIDSDGDLQMSYEVVEEVLRRWGGPFLLEGEEGARAVADVAEEVRGLVERRDEGRALMPVLAEVGVSIEVSREGI